MPMTRTLIALLFAVLGLSSCAPRTPPSRPVVLVSVPPQAWLVERLAGDLVDIEVMVPPGADPHIYEPTIRQLRAVSRASVYVKVGHPHFSFERVWFDRLVAENPSMRVVDGARGVARSDGDPHLWTSVGAMHTMAIHTAGALAKALPGRAAEITKRLAGLETELDSLDAELRRTLEPCRGRSFLVFHPAWGYFAEQYGLVQIAIEHDGKVPAPGELARLIAGARAAGARTVFVAPQTSRSSAQVVADEVSGQVVTLDPLDRDWAVNMRRVAAAILEGCRDE
jgi:zinc transport system substrate-binding protein